MSKYAYGLFLFGWWLHGQCLAQKDTVSLFLDGLFFGVTHTNYTDSLLSELWNDGYVFAGLDSIINDRVYIHKGVSYDIDHYLIEDPSTKYSPNDPPSGYPFAQLHYDSIALIRKKISAYLEMEPGPLVVWDSIQLKAPIAMDYTFLTKVMGVTYGSIYTEGTVARLEQEIALIPFLTLQKRPDIAFSNGRARLFLDIESNPESHFEGVLGVQPNQDDGIMLTGYLNIELQNLFRSAKHFTMAWSRFSNAAQSLDLEYRHPFLLGSRLFLNGGFHVLKQDSSFVNQKGSLKLGTYTAKRLLVAGGIEISSGNNLITSLDDGSTGALADYRKRTYTLSLWNNQFERSYEKGESKLRYKVEAGISERMIGNSGSLQWVASAQYGRQLGLAKKVALLIENRWKFQGGEGLLLNEMDRMGGLQSLRGFNENLFYVSSYALSRIELRHYFESRSYLMLHYDQLMNFTGPLDIPFGTGGGFTVQTSNGLFSFVAAMGYQEGSLSNLANLKIHFGYTSRL